MDVAEQNFLSPLEGIIMGFCVGYAYEIHTYVNNKGKDKKI
jgi:hypothetical protein